MKINRQIVNFPKPIKIYQKKSLSEQEYLDYVETYDQLEYCVVQALVDEQNEYIAVIELLDGTTQEVDLKDPDMFDIITNAYPDATMFASVAFNLEDAIRCNRVNEIDDAIELFEKHYGKIK